MPGMVHTIRIVFGAQTQPQIEIQQGDYNSRTIQALCYDSNGALMGFDGKTVSVVYEIAGTPSDEYPVDVSGNMLTFTMPGLSASAAGAGKLQLRIYGAESLLHSAVIPYTVKASLEPGQGQEDQVPMLVLLVQQAQEAIAGANEAASTANQAAESASSAAISANEKAGIAASAANSANEAASNAATMASLAQTATANANSAANSASNAAESANQAAASANAAAASASKVADDVQQKADSGAFNGENGLDAPQINDTQITTTNPWSSMQIVKTLCPPFTASGATVQCTPVANYPLDVQVEITPTQEGTGVPSPENVRPIVGWDSVNVTRCGKNLWNYTLNSSGKTWIIPFVPKGTYTFSALSNADWWTGNPNENKWFLRSEDGSQLVSTLDFNNTIVNQRCYATVEIPYSGAFTLNTYSNQTVASVQDMQVEVGSIATAYAPYTGTTAALTLPETIYGGTLDAGTGTLTVNEAIYTLTGDEAWSLPEGIIEGASSFRVTNFFAVIPSTIICSHFIGIPQTSYFTAPVNSVVKVISFFGGNAE